LFGARPVCAVTAWSREEDLCGAADHAAGPAAFGCRLAPGRALGTLAEAEAFLRDRGLLTRTADGALPGLYEACHQAPYTPGSPGFTAWPATKWPWFGELGDRGYLLAAVRRGKNLLMTGEVAGLLGPDLPGRAHPHARRRPWLAAAARSSRRRRARQH
jgi:hypothetical protein